MKIQSQGKPSVTASEDREALPRTKGKQKGHSEVAINSKEWSPIAVLRDKKPRKAPKKPVGSPKTVEKQKINFINPVANFKGKLPNSRDHKFVQGPAKGK
ncbi:hypothetical protein O181_049076 [Austropuccinia psidii MF-1]|uniref:Uncharacterized protein n=1 Tax=Austropuccinia psidii MF-1 TaxID=1389203 RepID=A0A9Q3DZ71_9BASI|nr:hypothetical protein [Austropuccinia psidii MF-1]